MNYRVLFLGLASLVIFVISMTVGPEMVNSEDTFLVVFGLLFPFIGLIVTAAFLISTAEMLIKKWKESKEEGVEKCEE